MKIKVKSLSVETKIPINKRPPLMYLGRNIEEALKLNRRLKMQALGLKYNTTIAYIEAISRVPVSKLKDILSNHI